MTERPHDRRERSPADAAARRQALDTARSCIVQAPAGSGKTRLLIQRYLALLAVADEPEEVVAITFTRKAAAEMRLRVLTALAAAAAGTNGTEVSEDRETAALAAAVLQRQADRGWALPENAARLRIQTIDALNAALARQLPVLSRFGAQPAQVQDAMPLYREAARALLGELEAGGAVADDVATLLAHLDNDVPTVEGLLIEMLRFRDQWLRHAVGADRQRDALEAALRRLRQRARRQVSALFPEAEWAETLILARFSGHNRSRDAADAEASPGWAALAALTAFPADTEADMPAWRAIADLLLTKQDGWRLPGGVTAREGFPPGKTAADKPRYAEMKERFQALLRRLGEQEPLRLALACLRALPAPAYDEADWRVLGAIVRLLPRATAHLWSVFGRAGQCDFVETALAAQRALGEDEAPTDLALALDYRIRHLLVDEFQDTSYAQFNLLLRLTRGWTEGDGRTLFAVGDPMQSIYRFREAEVGLFLDAMRHGIGPLRLQPLALSANFRSSPAIVDWVNRHFAPPDADRTEGTASVVYGSPSVAERMPWEGPAPSGVSLHWISGEDAAAEEAALVVEAIHAARRESPQARIAVLVRYRTHLAAIVPALAAADIAIRAVEIDPLQSRPIVQDLAALVRAVRHLDDRIAWLVVLRAPWCGLSLHDLAVLTRAADAVEGTLQADAACLWERLHDETRLAALSAEGRACVRRLREPMATALRRVRREPLRGLVERLWIGLNGPLALSRPADCDDALAFLDLLEAEAVRQTGGSDLADLDAFDRALEKLHASPSAPGAVDSGTPPVEVMTIHKSKGLEFDTVIVPALHRISARDDKRLMVWCEQPAEDGREFLLAPIRAAGGEDSDLYRTIAGIEREQRRGEDLRLLYVAATRAVRRLHLIAALTVKQDGEAETCTPVPPTAGSLLAAIWPRVRDDAVAFLSQRSSAGSAMQAHRAADVMSTERPSPRRLTAVLPAIPLPDPIQASPSEAGAPVAVPAAIDFDWAGETARHIGTVTHRWLQRIAEEGLAHWEPSRVERLRPVITGECRALGVERTALPAAVARVVQAIVATLNDDKGRWLLAAHHDARSEWRLTGVVAGCLAQVAIDRSFVDVDGTRWIVDFKTGRHEGADVEAFLDSEARRYREQLETYAVIVRALEPPHARIRLALYFPMHCGWREWEA